MLIRKRIHADFHIVLILEAVFQHIELQYTDHADDDLLHSHIVLLENLDRTFLRNLLHALHELLALHRIHLPHSRKMLRCERRDSLELKRLRRGECISDGKNTRIKHTDDVSRIRLVHDMTLLRHHLLRLRKLDLFIAALHVCHFHAGGKLARADAHKRNSVTVCLVHVCLNLEYKRREILTKRINFSDIRLARQRRVSHL